MSIVSITFGLSLSPPMAILTLSASIALSLYTQQRIVGIFPGTIIFGIPIASSASVPFHAERATSRSTLYFNRCTFVSNFLTSVSIFLNSFSVLVFLISFSEATRATTRRFPLPSFSIFLYNSQRGLKSVCPPLRSLTFPPLVSPLLFRIL